MPRLRKRHNILLLSRVDLADIHDPIDLAASVHAQFGPIDVAVPIERIAKALDIRQIEYGSYDGFAGMLLTNRIRTDGAIMADVSRGERRARFTVAHELAHFLLERHVLSSAAGFACTDDDLCEDGRNEQHCRQETEANDFAIELMAPRLRFVEMCDAQPDLSSLKKLSEQINLSREATARRFVQLSKGRVAVVFHHNRVVRYSVETPSFGTHSRRPRTAITAPQPVISKDGVSDVINADPVHWFDGPPMADLSVQWLQQADGYGMVMLVLKDM